MQDNEQLKQTKNQCLTDLTEALPRYRARLDAIDPRLYGYVADAVSNGASHANLFELLGIRKVLRLTDSYDVNADRVRLWLRAIEGVWKDGRHVKGGLKFDTPRGNDHVQLMPYQVWCVYGIYAFDTEVSMERDYYQDAPLLPSEFVRDGVVWDTRRLCQEAHLFQTRKSGKTEFGASLDFVEANILGPANAQCLICTNSREQSKIAYKSIKQFCWQIDPTSLNRMGGKMFRVTADEMSWQPGHTRKGEIKVMSAGGKKKDGLYASMVHADEHGSAEYVNGASDMQGLVDVCFGSTGPRREKLLLHTTTAGRIKEGPYKNQLQNVEDILLTEIDYPLGQPHRTADDKWFAFLLQLDKWETAYDLEQLDNPELFRKVNRSIGITVQPTYYSERLHDARMSEDTKKEVLSKDFNIWEGSRIKEWIRPDSVRALQRDFRIDDCKARDGWVVFTGLDFSQGDDLHCAAYLAARRHPSGRGTQFRADFDAWVKEDIMQQSSIRALYERWIEGGWLHVSPGKVFQPSLFVQRLDDMLRQGVQFMAWGYDKYQSKDPINTLKAYLQSAMGVADPDRYVQVVSQLNSVFNGPTDDLYNAMFAPVPFIEFSPNPMWPWLFGNAMLETDTRENKRPVKRSQSDSCKIDPVQALIMALELYERFEGMQH